MVFRPQLELFSIPNFVPCLFARFFLTFARTMRNLTIGWQVYDLTHDPLALGLIGLSEAVPYVASVLWAGYEIDHGHKRLAFLRSVVGHFFCSLALVLLANSPHPSVYAIYLVVALAGLFTSYETVSASAYFQMIVPKSIYPRAAAWHISLFQFAIITGPILAGLIINHYTAAGAYACTVLFLACSALFALSLEEIPGAPSTTGETPWQSIAAGIKYVRSRDILFAAMALDMLGVLFGDVVAILPIFADLLGVDAFGLGILRAAPAAGSFLMAQIQSWHMLFKPHWRTLLGAITLFGVTVICFALSHNFYLSVALLAFGGMADSVSIVIRHSMYQAFTTDEFRGRVSAINGIFIKASNEIGAFESGLAAKLMGTVPSVIFGGSMTILVAGVMGWRYRGKFREV